jgi:hypothetical protein
LLTAIAVKVHRPISQIKVFRLGKELSVSEDGRKTVASLKIANNETLMIAERPPLSASKQPSNHDAEVSTTTEGTDCSANAII